VRITRALLAIVPAVVSAAVLPALLAAPARADDAAPRSLSYAEAESLSRKFKAIEIQSQSRARKPASVLITEGELNSYLNLTYAPELPGITDMDIRIDSERIEARGLIDLERVRGKVPPPSPWSPLALLRGKVPVVLTGKLRTRDGFGTIEVEEAWISSIPVPMSLVEQIVASATKKPSQPEGFDIHAPFRLPYYVNRVRLESARAFLDF
jgi:hypothetical protein